MSSRKFLIGFALVILLICGIIVGFNYVTNPFGVMTQEYYDWESYNMSQNARIAKFTYLDQNYENYNAYIIGSSGGGCLTPDTLNTYGENSYYNLFYYGMYTYDSLKTATYIVENYEVDEIILPISFSVVTRYRTETDDINYIMDYKVADTSPINFYWTYLFAHPQYGLDKIDALEQDSYFQLKYDVFVPDEGVFDKSLRDVEYIGSVEEYSVSAESFHNIGTYKRYMKFMDEGFADIQKIKDLCDENDVKLTVVMYPLYETILRNHIPAEVDEFYERLGSITDFWDFTYSSISRDSRYFYDPNHCRNVIGDMMIAKMHGDDSVYMPDDFGVYVEYGGSRTFEYLIADAWATVPVEDDEIKNYSADVPVLMFHHIAEEASNASTITEEKFTEVMTYIKDEGYETVDYDQLYAYVNQGVALPEKPIMITFDDGYASNYEIAYEILKENGQKATIFPIGWSIGEDTYKDTDVEIIDHFTIEQAIEMVDSGVIDIGSHTYDLHQSIQYEEDEALDHDNMLQLEGETEGEYIQVIRDDCAAFNEVYAELGLGDVEILAYPYGAYTKQLTSLLREEGIMCTFTVEKGMSTIIMGMPQTLYNLKRNNVDEETDIAELLRGLE